VAPSGQSDSVSVTKGVAAGEEPATQSAQIGEPAPRAEASIDNDGAEDQPLGSSVVGASRKAEEGKLDEAGGTAS
jgi:hypothetical protein